MPTNNQLFPVFLKLDRFRVLLIGGGPIGLEKLTALVNNSPNTNITLVAKEILPEIDTLAGSFPLVTIQKRAFLPTDIESHDIIIAAVSSRETSAIIVGYAKKWNKLINVADTPDLCDFYLGSIVQKGNLKIAISTNGKSPTLAKRIKEFLNEVIPEDITILMDNLAEIRTKLKGDFSSKVKTLNEITATLLYK